MKIKDKIRQQYDNMTSDKDIPYSEWEALHLKDWVDNWKDEHSQLNLYDRVNKMWYIISTSDSYYSEGPQAALKDSKDHDDPIKELWYTHMVYDDLSDYKFSKPALEIIKQKGLYRNTDSIFALRRIVDEFGKFGISLPADIGAEITKLNKGRVRFSDIKPGETESDFHRRRETEKEQHTKKQKQDFDQAPPPQEDPDSWRTQSVEFEHKLVARLRRL